MEFEFSQPLFGCDMAVANERQGPLLGEGMPMVQYMKHNTIGLPGEALLCALSRCASKINWRMAERFGRCDEGGEMKIRHTALSIVAPDNAE